MMKIKTTWKKVKEIKFKIEKEHREGEEGQCNTPMRSYRLTFENNQGWKNPKVQIESMYVSTLLHDFGHLLLALTNQEHHEKGA